ncbi:MAG TPA: alcohol dehydrogenase catalytic domain-containing protein [Candidatus Atribacteria bacterium]|nr:alcohol dehydrogenase catalytic domain-containing protein [Candidatus Atribacteria bacterium]
MKALVFIEPGHMEIREVPKPECPAGGLLVQVKACGFCGSDLRTYRSGHSRVTPPWIIGHEISGIVEEVGKGVNDFKEGDKVAIAPPVYCGKCWYCKRGIYHLCFNQREIAQHWPGGFAEYVAIPPEALAFGNVHLIPNGLSFEEAAISEPASSCINAQEIAQTSLEDQVVIIGAGPIGCFHVQIARARGAEKILLTDLLENRLELARRFSPDLLIQGGSESGYIEKIIEETQGLGPSVVVVAAPSGEAQREAIQMAAKGGRVIFFGGLPKDKSEVLLDSNLIHYRGLHVIGTTTFSPKHHEIALSMMSSHKIHARDYITHLLPLEKFQEGIDALLAGKALKVVFQP